MGGNKMMVIFLIVVLLIIIWIAIKFWKPNFKKSDILFVGKNVSISAEVANSPSQWARGLMYRDDLPDDEGMIFIFPIESRQSFWMKNVKFPLDIIFLSKDKKIVDIKENFEPCESNPCPSYKSPEKSKFVLEVGAGFVNRLNLQIGDEVEFNL